MNYVFRLYNVFQINIKNTPKLCSSKVVLFPISDFALRVCYIYVLKISIYWPLCNLDHLESKVMCITSHVINSNFPPYNANPYRYIQNGRCIMLCFIVNIEIYGFVLT